jgi:hypothetical protein
MRVADALNRLKEARATAEANARERRRCEHKPANCPPDSPSQPRLVPAERLAQIRLDHYRMLGACLHVNMRDGAARQGRLPICTILDM